MYIQTSRQHIHVIVHALTCIRGPRRGASCLHVVAGTQAGHRWGGGEGAPLPGRVFLGLSLVDPVVYLIVGLVVSEMSGEAVHVHVGHRLAGRWAILHRSNQGWAIALNRWGSNLEYR